MSHDSPENAPFAPPDEPSSQHDVPPPPPPYARPYGTPPHGSYGGPPYPPQHPGWRPPPPGYPPSPVDPTLAEFWQRLVGRLLDGVVISIVMSPLWLWFYSWYLGKLSTALPAAGENDPAELRKFLHLELKLFGVSLLLGAAAAVIMFFYDWYQHAKWGQTIGKRIVKIKVVSLADRGPVTGGAAAKRAAVYGLAPQVPLIGSLFGLLNSLWLLWDKPNRQCLHDKAAGTVVIKTEMDPGPPR
jgi:uncharacterized RDD family membrane protein YckC